MPVTTNFMGPEGLVLDPWEWGREVDVVAVDHYLSGTGALDGHADIAFVSDWARGVGGERPWLLMEQAPGTATGPDGMQEHRAPGRMLRDSLGYVARGSDSVLFFQWRASRSGAEMYHPALVPHTGADSRIFREAVSLGSALERLSEVSGSVTAAGAALIVDAESRWALDTRGLPSPHVRHLDVARALHRALWRAGISCDIAAAGGDLSGYRLVVVPAVYLLSPAAASSLRRYVTGGGHLVVTFCSGIADSSHRVYTGGYPGALRDVLGIRVEEFHPLRPGETALLTAADGLAGARGSLWTERLRAEGATVLARYAEGVLAGLPAVTRHPFGRGTAWYVSSLLTHEPLGWLVRAAAAAAGLTSDGVLPDGTPTAPDAARVVDAPGVAVSRRTDGDGRSWLFAFNHGDGVVTLPASGVDLLSGREVTGTLALAAGAVAVIRELAARTR